MKLSFKLSVNSVELLGEVDRVLLLERAKPFQNDSQKYNYLLQLGMVRFLDDNKK